MKKKSIFILVPIIAIVLIAVLVVMLTQKNDSNTIKNEESTDVIVTQIDHGSEILNCVNKSEIKAIAEKYSYQYVEDEEYGYIYDVDCFGFPCDFEINYNANSIDMIKVVSVVFKIPYPIEDSSDNFDLDDFDSEFDFIPHSYTDEEKEEASFAFNLFKARFESFVGCDSILRYDSVSTGIVDVESMTALSDEENFYKGNTLREYSVRNAKGTLWLLHHFISDYYVTATVVKVVDNKNYSGFLPIIDMTKN